MLSQEMTSISPVSRSCEHFWDFCCYKIYIKCYRLQETVHHPTTDILNECSSLTSRLHIGAWPLPSESSPYSSRMLSWIVGLNIHAILHTIFHIYISCNRKEIFVSVLASPEWSKCGSTLSSQITELVDIISRNDCCTLSLPLCLLTDTGQDS